MKETLCPSCGKPIYDQEALLCHFCGESLQRQSGGALGAVRGGGHKIIRFILVGLVLLSFVLFFVF